jgi:hypothetical protein
MERAFVGTAAHLRTLNCQRRADVAPLIANSPPDTVRQALLDAGPSARSNEAGAAQTTAIRERRWPARPCLPTAAASGRPAHPKLPAPSTTIHDWDPECGDRATVTADGAQKLTRPEPDLGSAAIVVSPD